MYPTQKQLENYAEIAVKVGANVQPNQTVVVMAPITSAPLVRLIASKAYEVGAKNVHVEYNDEELSRIKFKQAPEEAFSQYPMFRAKGWEDFVEEGAAFISIYSPNPDLLNDVDPARVATASKTASTAMKNYRGALMNHTNAWTLVSYPTNEWASKVFPDATQEEAVQKLWERIIDATRIGLDNPVQAWNDHNAKLLEMVNVLNDKRYKQLQYEAPGTKLTVDLPEGHIWLGGSKANSKGIYFNPNMPTEEVFTMPHKDGVNGVVSSTKPLNYNGQVIDGFTLTFKEGKVVEFSAEKGYDALSNLLNTDDGARHLGEIALVPHDSPISNSNVVFFNTLYDENASCHLALGQAYPVNLKGGTKMSPEELLSNGANRSLTHEDFMIGSEHMNIDGVTQDGKLEPIFRNGNWAI
ncbi:aminopeptidase [Paenibacillus sp. GSMTC-2017]|uniref:aminopeptidase n=1 Tax=Paenibacillus sp. GSMTC-2017 TaxID=2794350 RepID=UPI0018D6EA00|nr:aminopeptidase [Paenibacillus sp. GSMTC-2017]MBH5316211.1 aminopeptidase [Paenibacillus sp. GSMTC-2017]